MDVALYKYQPEVLLFNLILLLIKKIFRHSQSKCITCKALNTIIIVPGYALSFSNESNILKLVLCVTIMELTLLFIYFLLNINFGEGFKISSKLNFDDEGVVDPVLLSPKSNETENEGSFKPVETRNFEAKIPVVVTKKNDGYEVKIPLSVESNESEVGNKVKVFSGLLLFERRSDTKEKEPNLIPLPIVKGSVNHLKPDFLIPVRHEPTTTELRPQTNHNYNFLSYWPDRLFYQHKAEIEGLEPPPPDKQNGNWILDPSPFVTIEKNTSSSSPNKDVGSSTWQVLESGLWNSRYPLSWNQDQNKYWQSKKKGWSDSKPKYYTRNIRYQTPHKGWNNFYQEPLHKPGGKGFWISCPPFEIGGVEGRQTHPGCPQKLHGKPSDVETISVTPVIKIDDKTLFKELEITDPKKSKA